MPVFILSEHFYGKQQPLPWLSQKIMRWKKKKIGTPTFLLLPVSGAREKPMKLELIGSNGSSTLTLFSSEVEMYLKKF